MVTLTEKTSGRLKTLGAEAGEKKDISELLEELINAVWLMPALIPKSD